MSELLAALVGDAEVAAALSDDAELKVLLEVEVALAWAAADAGLVAPEAAVTITAAAAVIVLDRAALARGIATDGVVVPALVKQLRDAVGEQDGKAVHLGATSQDIIDTGLVLRLRSIVDLLERRLGDVVAALDALAARDGGVTQMAHTRMQRALPFTAGDRIAAWRGPFIRHLERLPALRARLLVIQLGGPVGTRDAYGGAAESVAAAFAARLGLGNAPQWHSQRDRIAELGGFLTLVAGSAGKIGQDAALLAQNEVGAVRLAGGGGSSSMAHKNNPIGAEVLVALARYVAGLNSALQGGLIHENERSGAAWTLEWLTLPPMLVATGSALRQLSALISGLRFVAEDP